MATTEGIKIGGTKGHNEEVENDPIFITIYNSFRWKMIPNCTGRYTCRDHKAVSYLKPKMLLDASGVDSASVDELQQYYVTFDAGIRKDPIYVVPFAENRLTGLITYVKRDDDGGCVSYVHTLNSESGFQRKLEALKVILSDEYLVIDSKE
mmetsp:Transcript_29727/g.62613  ORF Transcript_29727/g.62613 Transcript_29727/m.62613 type:complete len:151 (+) Transcript_29727:302-754(+)